MRSGAALHWIARIRIVKHVLDIFPHQSAQSTYYNALALCGEVGELANILKKRWRGDNDPDFEQKAASELADVIICALLLGDDLGLNMDVICDRKTREVVHRHPEVLKYMQDHGYTDELYKHVDVAKGPEPLKSLKQEIVTGPTYFGVPLYTSYPSME